MSDRPRSRPPKSEAFEAVHEMMSGLHRSGLVDLDTMREFDALCLDPATQLSPTDIRALREREKVSQPVFAHYLNVSKGLVGKWERGETKPKGPSLKLLNLVREKGLKAIA